MSDPVCPWCYVGKRRLEKALAERPELDVQISWQPFQLNPDMPRAGRNRQEYYREKFGEARAEQIMASIQETGAAEGIAFGTEPGAKAPNTLSAHALMLWGGEDDTIDANALADKLFYAHHVECEDIGDHEVLVRIAAEVGFDANTIREKLSSGEDEQRVKALAQHSAERGGGGVPFFVINGRYGLSGAQPPELILQALDQIVDETNSP